MIDAELQALIAAAQKRNDLFYGWLRHLLLMANGTLAVLVSLDAGRGSTGMALDFLRVAWATLGLGILSGSIALYAEVVQAKALVSKASAEYIERRKKNAEPSSAPTYVPFARWMQWSVTTCHASLTAAVVSLTIFALLRQ